LTLRPEQIVSNYPDIKRNGKCFTDGAGHISPRLAAYVSERFGYLPCSAFQIRIGGAKGVLMTMKSNDDLINDGRRYDIRLRESQIKFPSNDLSFNVVRCATYSQGYLNRQLIILMSCLGVPDEVFIELQRKAK
jgi:RNA-dependent RNA polymerase